MSRISTKFIADNAITNAKLAQAPTLTLKGNNTGGTANELDLTVSQVNTMLGDLLKANNLSDVSSASTSFNNISPITSTGDLIVGTGTNTAGRLAIGTTGQVLTVVGGTAAWVTDTDTSGTVTSVGLSVPATSIFGVSGTPVTTSGTIALTTTGTSGGIPYFSSTSQLASSALLVASQLVIGGGAGVAPSTLAIGSTGQVLTVVGGVPAWANDTDTSGTVTSVAMTVPAFLSVAGSPITSSGTLAVTLSGTALPVANGGTGDTSFTANQVILGGTTTTGALGQVAGGTTGFVLTSTGTTTAPTWQAAGSGATLTSLGIMSGKTAISSGATSKAITFSTAFGSTGYAITGTMLNTTDTNPDYIPVTVTVQSTTGATFSWNAPVPTANYSIMWHAIINN